jgi:phage gpG-like protein
VTTIKVEMDGLQQLLSQLKAVGAASDTVILETMTDLVTDTQAFAIQGIQRGPKSGRTYRRGNVVHTASAPGQYPATDTGRLASSVRAELPTEASMTARVGTSVAYGPMLEFGTSRMAARPWLLPSFQKAKIGVEQELRARLEARL